MCIVQAIQTSIVLKSNFTMLDIRGAAKEEAVEYLGSLIRIHRSDLILLQETHLEDDDAKLFINIFLLRLEMVSRLLDAFPLNQHHILLLIILFNHLLDANN